MPGLSGNKDLNAAIAPTANVPVNEKQQEDSAPPNATPVAPPPNTNPFLAGDLTFGNDWLSMLVYGDFGVGKTYFAGSAVMVESYRDILYIELEGGRRGLKQLARDAQKKGIDLAKHVLAIKVESYKQYASIYEFLKLHVKFRDDNNIVKLRALEGQIRGFDAATCKDEAKMAELIPEPKKIRTVITDSLSEAQKYCMYQLLGIKPDTQKLDDEPGSAEWQDWGRSREMIQFLVRRLRDLPVNSIFICGQDTEQDATKRMYFEPLLPGKLSKDVRGLVDIVGFYTIIPQEGDTIKRRMYLAGGEYNRNVVAAKNRFGETLKQPWVDDPTMETIHKLDTL